MTSQDNASSQELNTGLASAFTTLPGAVISGVGAAATVMGITAALVWSYRSPTRTHRRSSSLRQRRGVTRLNDPFILAISLLLLEVAAWLGQGIIGTPLVARYLVLADLLLIALACAGLAMFVYSMTRRPWLRLGGVALTGLAMVASSTGAFGQFEDLYRTLQFQRSVEASLNQAASAIPSAATCGDVFPTATAQLPVLALMTALKDRQVKELPPQTPPTDGWVIVPRDLATLNDAGFGPPTDVATATKYPSDFAPIYVNRHWSMYAHC